MNDILIIGFGASSLNLRALLSASYRHNRRIHYLDSLDSNYVEEVLAEIDLETCETYIISKSGATSETNILTKLVIEMGARNIRVICGNKDSELARIISEVKYDWIDFVGEKSGRFALLTKPFLDIVAGIDINTESLLEGAESINMSEIEDKANIWLKSFEEGRRIWVIMLYSKQLYGLFMWIRQIVSESVGKEGFGILPFLCEGSMDEHSQLQLFLDGPRDKFYEVISCDYNKGLGMLSTCHTNHAKKVSSLLKAKDLPYEHIHHEEIDAYLVGKYIATYLNLVKIIGKKLGFDAMNQPAVESMKERAANG